MAAPKSVCPSCREADCLCPDEGECDAAEFGAASMMLAGGGCRCVVCARCGHHTGNSHQGHYWRYCKVTRSLREFHFCCPGNCELGDADDPGPRGEREDLPGGPSRR